MVNDGPTKLYCDNKATFNIGHNPVQHDKKKYIKIDRHFIKEELNNGLIYTPFVKLEKLTDVFLRVL